MELEVSCSTMHLFILLSLIRIKHYLLSMFQLTIRVIFQVRLPFIEDKYKRNLYVSFLNS